jgi:hypothetical protein
LCDQGDYTETEKRIEVAREQDRKNNKERAERERQELEAKREGEEKFRRELMEARQQEQELAQRRGSNPRPSEPQFY